MQGLKKKKKVPIITTHLGQQFQYSFRGAGFALRLWGRAPLPAALIKSCLHGVGGQHFSDPRSYLSWSPRARCDWCLFLNTLWPDFPEWYQLPSLLVLLVPSLSLDLDWQPLAMAEFLQIPLSWVALIHLGALLGTPVCWLSPTHQQFMWKSQYNTTKPGRKWVTSMTELPKKPI